MKLLLNILIGALLSCSSFIVSSAPVKQIVLQAREENSQLYLKWWVEGIKGQVVKDAKLLIDNVQVLPTRMSIEPVREQAICYLMMVDTSLSMKKYFRNNSLKSIIETLINNKPEKHSLGLAFFAKEWREIQRPIKDKRQLLSKLRQLKLKGKRTELLRFAKEGVASLNQCPQGVYRKVLIILSDGDAEDKADTVEHAVQIARNNKVSMYSFGFGDTGKLQFPRRLSEESGGWQAEPQEHTNTNRKNVVKALYIDSNTGGELQASIPKNKPRENAILKLTLSDGTTLTKAIPITIKEAPKIPAWKKEILDRFPQIEKQLDYILWGIGLLILGLIAWLLSRILRNNTPPDEPRNIEGYLIHQGESFPIYSGITCLGSLPNNDVIINEDTVSRTHATLHYRGEGDIILTDLNSLNGSRVNGNRVQQPMSIQDGDTVALGHWTAIFQRTQEDRILLGEENSN